MDSAWKKMKESVSDWMTLSDAEKNAQYDTFLAYADQKCLRLMLTELERIGLLSRQTNGGFAVVPAAENKIVAEQKATVSRWLEILKKESILQKGLKEINLEVEPFGLPEAVEAVEAVDTYFEKLQPYLEAMIIGKEKPLEVFYQKEADLAPNRLLARIPGHSETIRELTEILKNWKKCLIKFRCRSLKSAPGMRILPGRFYVRWKVEQWHILTQTHPSIFWKKQEGNFQSLRKLNLNSFLWMTA